MIRAWALSQAEVREAIASHVRSLVGHDRIGSVDVVITVTPATGIVDVPETGYTVTAQVNELDAPKSF